MKNRNSLWFIVVICMMQSNYLYGMESFSTTDSSCSGNTLINFELILYSLPHYKSEFLTGISNRHFLSYSRHFPTLISIKEQYWIYYEALERSSIAKWICQLKEDSDKRIYIKNALDVESVRAIDRFCSYADKFIRPRIEDYNEKQEIMALSISLKKENQLIDQVILQPKLPYDKLIDCLGKVVRICCAITKIKLGCYEIPCL